MSGRAVAALHRVVRMFMLLVVALWLALLAIVFTQWFAAGADQWVAANYDAGGAEGTRAVQMWQMRLSQAIVAGPVLLALLAIISGRRGLVWTCAGLVVIAAVPALLLLPG